MNNDLGEKTSPNQPGVPGLPDDLRLGAVHVVVTDLDRSAEFYERAIGLRGSERGEEDGKRTVSFTAGADTEDVLVLHERPDARSAGRHAGLYHFALLHPTRNELARALRRLVDTGTPIQGASDHGISEAIYLPDPDGNGIELAADRPRDRWGDLRDPTTIGPAPLDLQELLSTVASEEPAPHVDRDLRVGHLHMHVGHVEQALAFYRDIVGFEVMTHFDTAAFVSAGGYHHHLALNVWRGPGVPPAPDDAVGLHHWTVVIDPKSLNELRDRFEAAGVEIDEHGAGILVRDPWNAATLFLPG